MPKKARTLDEAEYLTVASMAARGFRHEDIARRLGVGHATWFAIKDRDPKALEAFEAGRSELHEELIGLLVERAREGNVACLLFSLKILYGYRENQPVPIEHNHTVRIELPKSLSPAEYAELAKAKPAAIDAEVISS